MVSAETGLPRRSGIRGKTVGEHGLREAVDEMVGKRFSSVVGTRAGFRLVVWAHAPPGALTAERPGVILRNGQVHIRSASAPVEGNVRQLGGRTLKFSEQEEGEEDTGPPWCDGEGVIDQLLVDVDVRHLAERDGAILLPWPYPPLGRNHERGVGEVELVTPVESQTSVVSLYG